MNRIFHLHKPIRLVSLRLMALVVLLVPACLVPPNNSPAPPASSSGSPPAENWLTVRFTDPGDPDAYDYRGGPDAALAEAIDQARVSVDAAIYNLNLWSIRDALLRAHRRGLTVRLVVESDNLDEPEIQALKNEAIPLLGDRREGLMHDKFVILDRKEVWTGSMNFTTSDGYLNDNNLVQVRSEQLAENFTVEFEEMFEHDLFGPDLLAATPFPSLMIGGIQVETYFSPDDGVAQRFVALIRSAQESIYFLAFSFTADDIANALIEQASAGVVVAGVFDESQVKSNIGSEYARLLGGGIDVRLDGNPRNMHHKMWVVDEQVVAFGSYNFSNSAETRNDENVLIVHDPQTAAAFMAEFWRIFEQAHR